MRFASQSGASVRLEWGAAAVEHLAGDVDCVVVVDVMSFSTCVDVAVARGAHVLPYAWRDASAPACARERGAEVASVDRRLADGWSLSPTSLRTVPAGLKLVLPSPNGSAIAFLARDKGVAVFERGFAADIDLCPDEDASDVAARLDGDRFVAVAKGAAS